MRSIQRLRNILVLIVVAGILPERCTSSPFTMKTTDQAFVISTTTTSSSSESLEVDNNGSMEVNLPVKEVNDQPKEIMKEGRKNLKPEIYSFKIHSDIKYRYARTYVTSRVVNANPTESHEVTFQVVLPETAFISKFMMEIDGIPYEAYVKEKEAAKKVYTEAQSQGQSAGLVEVNTRNANVFNVNVNIKSQSKVNFNLTYEELLSRRLGRYEQSISITPDQITNVKDFQITVNIEESQNFTLLRVPNLRNDVDAQQDADGNNQDAVIERPAGNKANITWKPSEKDQSQLGKQGITGKFVVQYDIKRELEAGEVLVMNGYFVHFFAPENLPPLRKHVVFVLDTSGSMWGRRMEQLKEAMNKILADLTSDDFFNIFTFSSDVVLWSPDDKISTSQNSNWSPPPFHGERVVTSVDDPRKRQPYPASKENIEKAQKFIQSLVASGGTNIHDSIVQALNLTASIKKARPAAIVNSVSSSTNITNDMTTTSTPEITTLGPAVNILPQNVESLLMFLTDGEPTVGVTNPTSIQTLIQAANKNISVPIFSLAFGDGADFPFVRKLSLQNNGFARKIYEASDAALQLKGFYNEIASPLLANVKFNYTTPDSAYVVENVTITRFPTLFGGTEIAVAGILVPKPVAEVESTDDNIPVTQEPTETTDLPTPTLDDIETEANTLLLPTNQKYFDVEISGSGRDGQVHFVRPEVFSCHIPWGVHVIRPFPPRPTPAPTQEDLFLERLWAYLTIQQLIEKDLAQDSRDNEIEDNVADSVMGPNIGGHFASRPHLAGPFPSSFLISPTPTLDNTQPTHTVTLPTNVTSTPSNNETTTEVIEVRRNVTEVPETPKQKALRLALKFGFVTSLTSLVVVKPNSSDVTNAEAADAKPDAPDSLPAPAYLSPAAHKVAFISGGSYTSNRIAGMNNYVSVVPFSLSQPSFAAYAPPGLSLAGYPGPPPRPQLHGRPISSNRVTSTTNRRKPVLHTFQYPRPVMATVVAVADIAQEDEEIDYQIIPHSKPAYNTITTSIHTTSTPPLPVEITTGIDIDEEVTTEVTTLKSEETHLTLNDLTWFIDSPITVETNGTKEAYKVVMDDENFPFVEPANCTLPSGDAGQCVHLKDCIQAEFENDFQLYKVSYFCAIPIPSSAQLAAGVCCLKNGLDVTSSI